MADILIRGMEMPNNCIDCMFTTIDYDMCILAKNDLMLCGGKPSWCPLVPLPEGHGRLIDAGSLYDRLENTLTHFIKVKSYTESQKYAFGYCEAWNDAKAVLTNAPTIVPAEGGTERMTNEEAIEILKLRRRGAEYVDCLYVDSDDIVAIDMAISALEKQEGKKPLTNADRIRAMTDEELATLFTKVMAGNSWAQLDGIWQEKGMEENQRYFTRLNWLDWLKREVRNDTF